jgi:hypothetical protein
MQQGQANEALRHQSLQLQGTVTIMGMEPTLSQHACEIVSSSANNTA